MIPCGKRMGSVLPHRYRRKARFIARLRASSVLLLLLAPLITLGLRRVASTWADGICIVDRLVAADQRKRATEQTAKALAILDRYDRRRGRRVRRNLRFILFASMRGRVAQYIWPLRICRLDVEQLAKHASGQNMVWSLISVLVHEATHGAIYSKRIGYYKENRTRIEMLCDLEAQRCQNRLLRKLRASGCETLESLRLS